MKALLFTCATKCFLLQRKYEFLMACTIESSSRPLDRRPKEYFAHRHLYICMSQRKNFVCIISSRYFCCFFFHTSVFLDICIYIVFAPYGLDRTCRASNISFFFVLTRSREGHHKKIIDHIFLN